VRRTRLFQGVAEDVLRRAASEAALVGAGRVDAAEALSRSVDKAELARRLGRHPAEGYAGGRSAQV
jgi:hypothetical protein